MPGPSNDFLRRQVLRRQLRPWGAATWTNPFYENIMQDPVADYGFGDALQSDLVTNDSAYGAYRQSTDEMAWNPELIEKYKQRPGMGDTLRHEFHHRGANLLTDDMQPGMKQFFNNPYEMQDQRTYWDNMYGNEIMARMSDVVYGQSPETRAAAVRWLVREGQGDFAGKFRNLQQVAGRALRGKLEDPSANTPHYMAGEAPRSESDNPWWKFW